MTSPEEPEAPRGKAAREGRTPAGKVPADRVAADKAGDDVAPAPGDASTEKELGAAAVPGDTPEDAAGAPETPVDATEAGADAAEGATGGHPDAAPDDKGAYDSVDSPAAVQTGTPEPVGGAEPAPADDDGHADTATAEVALNEPTPAGPRGAPTTGVERAGMFMARDGGDTSGYGGLVIGAYTPAPAERPFGGYFDDVADAVIDAMAERSIPDGAIEQITIANGEMTYYLDRSHLTALLWALRDDPSLRFELLSSLSGVDYGPGVPRRLHVVYELTSMTYRRRVRLEVAVEVEDPHVPSAVAVYPTADWQEREAWDMFGIEFAGHPALTRILMPDDWEGHPQRKDYPLGGIPVEFKGAEIAPPDERRAYT
jgi:NADH-quinone oxidoreductase subunit C